jgi:hypothetical protein
MSRTRLWLGLALLASAVWTGVASAGLLAFGATAAAPGNDNFASAIALSGATVSRSGDTNAGATLQPGEATVVAGAVAGASVWYSWTAPADGMVVVDTATSDFDTLLGVYTGAAVNLLTEVASNDDFLNLTTSRVRFAATNGTVYRIRVDGLGGGTGTINLHVHQAPPPANDDFANAIVLDTQDDSRAGDTSDGATLEPGEDDIVADVGVGASVWYEWTAPVTGRVTIDTATSNFDTVLGVYTGASVATLVDVASNDDAKVPPTSLLRFDATAGTIYRIRVDGFAETSGTINLHLHEVLPAASPANDDFADAVALSGMTDSRTGDTNAGATREAGEADTVASEAAGVSVWYTWTAPATGTVTIDTATSGFDTLLAVYTGPTVDSLVHVTSNDDIVGALTSRVKFQATNGTVYSIRVDGYAGDTGSIELHLDEVFPPANDNFADAYGLGNTNVSRPGDTNLGATLEDGEAPTVAEQAADASTWYSWTAPQTTAVTIDTATSDFNTLLGVYTGTAVNDLTEVASNDDAGVGDQTSKVNFAITAGTVYRIRVDGPVGAIGTINLHVTLATVSDVPTNVTAIPGNGAATVSWTAPTDNGGSPVTGYEVTRYVGGVLDGTTPAGNVTHLTVNNLTNGTTYTFRVAATNVVGTGAQSAPSNAVTPRTVPDAPVGVSATAGAGQATVSWSAPAFNGGSAITGYAVTRYVAGVAQGTTNVGVVSQTTIGGLTNGTTYTFRVAAKNVAGTGTFSNESNAVTPRTVPGAPTSVSASPGDGQATVSWSAPASDGGGQITGYDVTSYVAGVAQGTTSVTAVTQATVSGLTNGTAYTFRVAAKNAVGTGAQSAESSAVTPRTVPDPSTNASATIGSAGQATVSWSAPAYNGGSAVTGYEVTSYVAGVARQKIAVGTVTQAAFGGLTNGTAYTFRVAAKNVAGTGAQSTESNSVVPAVPKFAFTVTKSGTGSGTVTSSGGAINCGSSCGGDFDTGSSVTLTAQASSGSTFAGWSGPCTGIGTCTVWIDSAKTVTATFHEVESEQQGQQQGAKCVVPNVKRKPLAKAKRRIAAAHCRVGKVTKAKSATIPKGRVVAQKPPAGKKLAAGSKIKLVVSRGKR